MLHSFRLKIGLLSVFISGILLLGFGSFTTSVLNRVGRERIDRELRALADAQIRKEQPPGHWRRFDDSLRSIYGTSAAKQFVVQATHLEDGLLYATPNWPPDAPQDALPLALDLSAAPYQEAGTEAANRHPSEGRDGERPRPFDEPPRPPPPRQMRVRAPVYATIGKPDHLWRAMTIANEEVTLSIAMNLSGLQAEIRRFQRALLVAAPLGLLLLAAGGWLIGHVALRPVNVIARTAELVTAHRLAERIPDGRADKEFKRLIALINGMLERLERSFQQATRFSADAAHELKTPLAILQAQTERCLQQAADGSPAQREFAEQLDEVQRLKAILRKLLLLSQADAGHLPLSLERINLADTVREAADDVRMLAPDRQTTVAAPAALVVEGDADLLNQAIENLTSNAVKFGDQGGGIALALGEHDGQAVLTVSNTGGPIPAQDHDRVFDRFYRADKSRSREIEGSGLGLSLAREIARAHGGELVLQQSEELETVFALTLPLA